MTNARSVCAASSRVVQSPSAPGRSHSSGVTARRVREQGGRAFVEGGPHRSGMLQHRSSNAPERVRLVVDAEVAYRCRQRSLQLERRGVEMRCTTCVMPPSYTRYSAHVPGKSFTHPISMLGTPHAHAPHAVAVGVARPCRRRCCGRRAMHVRSARRSRRGAGRSSPPSGGRCRRRRSTADGGPSR